MRLDSRLPAAAFIFTLCFSQASTKSQLPVADWDGSGQLRQLDAKSGRLVRREPAREEVSASSATVAGSDAAGVEKVQHALSNNGSSVAGFLQQAADTAAAAARSSVAGDANASLQERVYYLEQLAGDSANNHTQWGTSHVKLAIDTGSEAISTGVAWLFTAKQQHRAASEGLGARQTPPTAADDSGPGFLGIGVILLVIVGIYYWYQRRREDQQRASRQQIRERIEAESRKSGTQARSSKKFERESSADVRQQPSDGGEASQDPGSHRSKSQSSRRQRSEKTGETPEGTGGETPPAKPSRYKSRRDKSTDVGEAGGRQNTDGAEDDQGGAEAKTGMYKKDSRAKSRREQNSQGQR